MKIKATSEIKSEASTIDTYIDKFSVDFRTLENIIQNVPLFWTGDDATKFIKKFTDEIFPELTKYKNSFLDYQKYLSKVYDVYSALEDEYDREIS